MKFASVFAGVGGFDLGFERAGMTPAWQCEINDDATTILQKHWPDVIRHGDVRSLDASEQQWGADVLVGGFPCQDVSLCGKMDGLSGRNSRLFWEFARVAEESGPRWVVLENAPGLLTGNRGRDFLTVLRALGQRGYVCAYRVFNARYFGVPQDRERVFVVGHLGDWRCAARVVLDADCLRQGDRDGEKERDRVTDRLDEGAPFVFQTRIARCKRGLPSLILPTLTSYEESGLHSDSKPHVVTSDGIRRLTVKESERAQGFPDDWTLGVPDRRRRALIGNAVVPAIAEWVARRIVSVENEPSNLTIGGVVKNESSDVPES